MTMKKNVSVTCPACHEAGEFTIYNSINTQLDPELREAVRDGSLFQFTCPHCGERTVVDYPFLYHEMEHHFMINYGPLEDGAKALAMLRGKGVADADWAAEMEKTTDPYVLRAVDDRLAFREKLFIFDAGLDDRIVEIYKCMVLYQFAAAGKAQGDEEAYFFTDSKGNNRVQVTRGRETVAMADFPRKMYRDIYNGYHKRLRDIRKSEPVIDQAWVRRFLQQEGAQKV